MQIEVVPVAQILEQLDFEPACWIGHAPDSTWPPCQLPAAWIRRLNCPCQEITFICHRHYETELRREADRGGLRCTSCDIRQHATYTRIPK